MTAFEASVIIRQPVDVVVAALMNPDNFTFWTKYLERFEVVQGAPGQPGAVGRLHYLQNGRRYVMEDRLIAAEPGRRYVSQVTGDPIEARVETTLREVAEGTEMNVRWTGRGKVFPLRFILPLLRGAMVRQSKEELNTFKGLVESRGSRFGP
jgi:hypothetical protein